MNALNLRILAVIQLRKRYDRESLLGAAAETPLAQGTIESPNCRVHCGR